MSKAKLYQSVVALLLFSAAHAATLVVYPFSSPDPRLGTAVSLAVAEVFEQDHEVFGPAVAPTLVPPFHVAGGYYNPSAFFEQSDSPGITAMLRDASGADVVVNGSIEQVDDHLILELQLAHTGGMSSMTVQAEAGDPGTLAARTAAITAHLLGHHTAPRTGSIDLAGQDGQLALAYHHAGLTGGLDDALEQLGHPSLQDNAQADRLRRALVALSTGTDAGDPRLLAALSLNTTGMDEARSAHYFSLLAEQTDLPAVKLWQAVLLASSGNSEAAGPAFEAAAVYPYGLANLHAWEEAPADVIAAAITGADAPALLTYSLLARSRSDVELEKQVLQRLSRVDPWQIFAFERLSFIGFDQDDALAAGQALAVAVTLAPGSDLYWTNLGWAQYLLGLLEQSEQSSIRATLLSPGQLVAHYNLGLVRAVTGRLPEAVEAYDAALNQDPVVNEAAIEDLVAALELWPAEPAVHYALAYLLEADGQRSEAARHYGLYLERVRAGSHADRARARLQALEAPAPSLRISEGMALFLGSGPVSADTVQAGDPLRPAFEVYTPGEVLPTRMGLQFSLLDAQGDVVLSEAHELALPSDTVGFLIDGFTVQLPAHVAPGQYTLRVTVSASESREASSDLALQVQVTSDPFRPVFGYGIVLQSVETGAPLFSRSDLGNWPRVLAVLQGELATAAAAAGEVIPEISTGRFSGMNGAQAFAATGESDLRDFLAWIAHPDLAESSFVFVDTYAQWILDGAPTD